MKKSIIMTVVLIGFITSCIGKNNINVTLKNPNTTVSAIKKLVKAYGWADGSYCAVLDNSTTQCWGETPKTVSNLSNVKKIGRSRPESVCYIKNDDMAYCYGTNSSGQLGTGAVSALEATAQPVSGLSGVIVDVQIGGSFSCALKNDGTVWCWGSNANGNLGNGTTVASYSAVQVLNITNATKIAVNHFSACALLSNESVWCWGDDSNGQLGNGATTTGIQSTPVQATISNVSDIQCGIHSCHVLKNDGTVWGWGYNANYQIGNGSQTNVLTPVQLPGLSNITNLYLTYSEGYALDSSGILYSWGRNLAGNLGDGTYVNKTTPSTMTLPFAVSDVDYFLPSYYSFCAVMKDKSITCIGIHVGNGKQAASESFVQPSGNLTVASVSDGQYGAVCAVTSGAGLKCWGRNDNLSLWLLGNSALYRTPQDIPGYSSGVSNVSTGLNFSCLLKTDGTVWCWGYNSNGQVGNNTTTNSSTPVQATNIGVASIFFCLKINSSLNQFT